MQALAAAVAVLAFGATAPAEAAASPAHAVVTACKLDSFSVVGAVKMTGRGARAVRGAVLQLRFSAVPLFGIPQLGQWRTVGKKTSGSGQQTFAGLLADQWYGVMSWRFKRGSRTVAGGDERSQPGRAGRVRGSAGCTLAFGLKPPDKTPPTITITPNDQGWHRGPVTIFARDDFSGVRSVSYSLDGGPQTSLTNGSSFPVSGDGPHTVHAVATDVAGNTATLDTTVHIDGTPPTKPALTRPVSVTASTQPGFTWAASSDSASGVRGYALTIRRASDNAVVFFNFYDASTTSVAPATLTDGTTYVATLTAGDNTDVPNTADSGPLTFRVDTHPDSSSPVNNQILSGSAKNGPLTIALDRPADPATVSTSTVVLDRNSESGSDPSYTVSCDSSCTTITVAPSSPPLGEGRYALSLNGVKSQEGLAMPGSFAFAVAFEEIASDSYTNSTCIGEGSSSTTPAVLTMSADEPGTMTFSYSFSGSGYVGVRVMQNGASVGDSGHLTASGPVTVPLALKAGSGQTVTVQYYAGGCSAANPARIDVSSLVASRNP